MAILHGSWRPTSDFKDGQPSNAASKPSDQRLLNGTLFIWAETWRGTTAKQNPISEETLPHPLAMDPKELSQFLLTLSESRQLSLTPSLQSVVKSPPKRKKSRSAKTRASKESSSPTSWNSQTVTLPAYTEEEKLIPLHSSTVLDEDESYELYPFEVQGLELSPDQTLDFLAGLPLHINTDEEDFLGSELLFWCHSVRWGLDLLTRSKFIPSIQAQTDQTCHFFWQPLLDSATDRQRFQQFVKGMPQACLFYQAIVTQAPAVVLPTKAGYLLTDFLTHIIDHQVRQGIDDELITSMQKAGINSTFKQWLPAFSSSNSLLKETKENCGTWVETLNQWLRPIEQSLQEQQYRACFNLQPPTSHGDWKVEYFLQATDDPTFLVTAEVVWNTNSEHMDYLGRKVERPQETLLQGLGLASRVYPLLEESLQGARPTKLSLSPTQAYDFIKAAAWRLEDSGFGVMLPPSLSDQNAMANRLGLQIKAAAQSRNDSAIGLDSLLNFQWGLAIGGQTLSKAEFDRLVAQESPLVEINGEWVEFRPQDVKAAQNFFASRQNKTGLSLEDALRISTGDTLTIDKLPVVSFEASGSLEALLTTLNGNQTLTAISEPPGFEGSLRPYQARGVGWLTFLEQWGLGACLADDMGLGKTVQFIAYLLHLKNEGRLTGPMLLVCPTSVLGNWEREVHRFGPKLKVVVHHGSGRPQGKTFLKKIKPLDLVITSYPLIHRDEKTLSALTWQGIVLDEAQNIKNPEARQSQAVRNLQAKVRIALTGTPLENRLTELWSILDFLNPGYLGPKPFFQRRFATPIERYGDTASLTTLRSLVQPFILRRTKTDRDIIQDLPEKQEMTVFCSLTPEQAKLYQTTVQESLDAVDAAKGIQRRGIILATLVKLKQICNHPAQYLHEETLDLDLQRSGKLKRLQEMLEELLDEGDRALIFTQFAELGKLLQQYLQTKLQRETLLLYGGSSKKQRESMIDRFQHDPQGPRIFILSLKAGGVGLNLTRANHVFHFDRWWNPAVENQATDRVFRIGQTRNVQVHKFVCTGTLEERIHEQLESKKALAEQVVGAGENWLTELDTDQLRNLLLLDRNAVIDEEET
ncbi:DEAD/DEAH box helicase [Acaryochloris marina]|uniref:SNF2 family helicase n=1 Tax=Acaryochloris marina (strain MBIC 11017) TaxID=329726 RepID=B0C1M7_ACAM1|nr:DEAD/DEAH box helicase [Acaryochloris marina]ABW30861.1 SNF2 family helicase [Acaryochloris marina MBIC11017]BDM79608.1 helicase [Acaryochloris marina MBIC10699]